MHGFFTLHPKRGEGRCNVKTKTGVLQCCSVATVCSEFEGQVSVQYSSLQCPSNAIWPFKIIHLSQNNPSERNPKLKMKTSSLEVLNTICPPQEPTSVGHCHYKKVELGG